MNEYKKVSIIITSCNRCSHLRGTLESVAQLDVPSTILCELIIVDNASTDETAEMVRTFSLLNTDLKYHYEEKRGQSNARNTGMAVALGDIFLWTDDDIRLPKDWIHMMCDPIINGKSEAVAGKIHIAKHLERNWMTRTHFDRLSDTRFMPEDFGYMIGANMAFSRKVLEKIPAFDPELGPGALGFADDTLFSLQIWEAGFKITSLPSVVVEHHVEPSRLLRRSWLRHGDSSGKSQAYLQYHWDQKPSRFPYLKMLAWKITLRVFRILTNTADLDSEGCSNKEIRMVQNISFMRQYSIESKIRTKYVKRGLKKNFSTT